MRLSNRRCVFSFPRKHRYKFNLFLFLQFSSEIQKHQDYFFSPYDVAFLGLLFCVGKEENEHLTTSLRLKFFLERDQGKTVTSDMGKHSLFAEEAKVPALELKRNTPKSE